MKFGVTRRADPLVDVTPMIDVVFQLVLFFMVSTTFIDSPGIQVELPKSSADVVVTEQRDASVWMTLDGQIICASTGKLSRYNAFQRIAEEDFLDQNSGGCWRVSAVVQLMDMARAAGLNRLAIATDTTGKTTKDP